MKAVELPQHQRKYNNSSYQSIPAQDVENSLPTPIQLQEKSEISRRRQLVFSGFLVSGLLLVLVGLFTLHNEQPPVLGASGDTPVPSIIPTTHAPWSQFIPEQYRPTLPGETRPPSMTQPPWAMWIPTMDPSTPPSTEPTTKPTDRYLISSKEDYSSELKGKSATDSTNVGGGSNTNDQASELNSSEYITASSEQVFSDTTSTVSIDTEKVTTSEATKESDNTLDSAIDSSEATSDNTISSTSVGTQYSSSLININKVDSLESQRDKGATVSSIKASPYTGSQDSTEIEEATTLVPTSDVDSAYSSSDSPSDSGLSDSIDTD